MSAGVITFQARNQGFTGANGTQIPFELVDINIGDAYNASGLFTAPVAGIYQFSYDFLADNTCGSNYVGVYLFVNVVHLMSSCSEYVASGGSSMILELVSGDTVSLIKVGACDTLHGSSGTSSFNQFSGHLLHEVL